MFERYTEDAREVLSRARQEAQKYHHDHIGTEHILLGLIEVKACVAAQILSRREIDLKHAKQQVEQMVVPGTPEDDETFLALVRADRLRFGLLFIEIGAIIDPERRLLFQDQLTAAAVDGHPGTHEHPAIAALEVSVGFDLQAAHHAPPV